MTVFFMVTTYTAEFIQHRHRHPKYLICFRLIDSHDFDIRNTGVIFSDHDLFPVEKVPFL